MAALAVMVLLHLLQEHLSLSVVAVVDPAHLLVQEAAVQAVAALAPLAVGRAVLLLPTLAVVVVVDIAQQVELADPVL